MSYLSDEEKQMPLDLIIYQLLMGLQSCKTKGEAKELMKELYEIGFNDGLKGKKRKRWLND